VSHPIVFCIVFSALEVHILSCVASYSKPWRFTSYRVLHRILSLGGSHPIVFCIVLAKVLLLSGRLYCCAFRPTGRTLRACAKGATASCASYSKPWRCTSYRVLHRILSLGGHILSCFASYSKPWRFTSYRVLHRILSLGGSHPIVFCIVF